MKKLAIIAGIILTTGLTALSISKKENKVEEPAKIKIENTNAAAQTTTESANVTLATAD